MQLRKSMFCDNTDDHGKARGDTSGISLKILHFAIQVQPY